ncbi:MAG TPA: serine--tRNA ligase, partial [Erysipelotrichaceae bacterium]|nr:serine--tRNA ligase [Erysipelotrichaceae bacterium]
MIDIKLIRENPEVVKENIKKKFQDEKLVLVDEVIELDKANRAAKQRGDDLRAERNRISKQIGLLMREGKKDEAEAAKAKVKEFDQELQDLEVKEAEYSEEIKNRMMIIP